MKKLILFSLCSLAAAAPVFADPTPTPSPSPSPSQAPTSPYQITCTVSAGGYQIPDHSNATYHLTKVLDVAEGSVSIMDKFASYLPNVSYAAQYMLNSDGSDELIVTVDRKIDQDMVVTQYTGSGEVQINTNINATQIGWQYEIVDCVAMKQ